MNKNSGGTGTGCLLVMLSAAFMIFLIVVAIAPLVKLFASLP